VTGAGLIDTASVEQKLGVIRAHTDLPVLVGFGIKDEVTAKTVGAVSDGVVVGSVLVSAMASLAGETTDKICTQLSTVIQPIRKGLDEI